MKRFEFEVDDATDLKGAVQNLRAYGVAVVPKYLSEKMLADLNREFEMVFQDENIKKHDGWFSAGKHVDIEKKFLDKEKYKNLLETFSSSFIQNVSKEIFMDSPFTLTRWIALTNEKPDVNPVITWHFDKRHTLKFYFNLIKSTRDNGAFEVAPGTHREGHYRSNFHLSNGLHVNQIPSFLTDDEVPESVPVEVDAGDLIIFDSSIFHRAGVVKEGHERRVIRGHSDPRYNYPSVIDTVKRTIYNSLVKRLFAPTLRPETFSTYSRAYLALGKPREMPASRK